MKRILYSVLILFAITPCVFGQTVADTMTIFEVDNVNHSGSPIPPFGRMFADGEFPTGTCPQPAISGVPVTNWQVDIRSHWPSGSIKFAVVTMIPTSFTALGSLAITFQSVSSSSHCDGTAGISKAAMVAYDTGGGAGSWDGDIEVTSGGVTETADAKTMLNTLSIGYGQVQVLLTGPVVTQVLVEDATTSTSFDFGALYGSPVASVASATESDTLLASTNATTNPCVVTDGYWTFQSSDVGNKLVISAGTGWTAGTYTIASVSGGAATLNSACGSTASVSGGTWSISYNGGSGCTTGNAVSFSGGTNGSGASFTATVSGGAITGYSQVSGGLGYATAPTASVVKSTCAAQPVAAPTLGAAVMNLNSGAWYTGTSQFASLHPRFILTFYGSSSFPVGVESILENEWTTRIQDQTYSLVLKTGAPLTIQDNPSTLLHIQRTRWKKTFWSGTAPGQVRIDYNFPYMIYARTFPNFDLTVPANAYDPTVAGGTTSNYMTSWAQWITGDRGDIAGTGGINAFDPSVADNGEGAPEQFESLKFLYNMSTGATANGYAAMAWQMLTGVSGAIDTGLKQCGSGSSTCDVPGGGGTWGILPNFPIHSRELRTTPDFGQSATNYFYCAGMAAINSIGGTGATCGGSATINGFSNSAIGRFPSRYTHPNDQWAGGILSVAPVGAWSTGPWLMDFPNAAHYIDYDYTAYILTGSQFFLEDLYDGMAWTVNGTSGGQGVGQSNLFFGSPWPGVGAIRALAWSLQQTAKAWHASTDGTPEQLYVRSVFDSNLEIMEGSASITGTSLTPSDTSCSTSSVGSYDYRIANRWNWGRCTQISQCQNAGTGTCTTIAGSSANALHLAITGLGQCPTDPGFVNQSVSSTTGAMYHHNWVTLVLGEAVEMGLTEALPSFQDSSQTLEKFLVDTTSNPWLIAAYNSPWQFGTGTCNYAGTTTDPLISNFTDWENSTASAISTLTTFDYPGVGNCPYCDHAYSMAAWAAGSFLPSYGVAASDANCPGGSCTPAATWAWITGHVPYMSLPAAGSTTLTAPFLHLKFAIIPRYSFSGQRGTGSIRSHEEQ